MSLTKHVSFVRTFSSLLRTGGKAGRGIQPLLKQEIRHAGAWGWGANILGVALGWKGAERQPALTLFVRARMHKSRLSAKEFVPEGFRVAAMGIEMLTDVVETGGPAELHAAFLGVARPGMSVGHENGVRAPGSGGALLQRPGDQHVYMLSAAHVMALARLNRALAAPGQFIESPFDPVDNPAFQQFAKLTGDFSPLTARATQPDDFAVARLLPGVAWNPIAKNSTRKIDSLSSREAASQFREGDSFTLYGMRNGPSEGALTHVSGSMSIPSIGDSRFATWTYQGLIPYTSKAAPGDSGACVVDKGTGRLVGVHVGGFPNIGVGLFFPIGPRLKRLGYEPLTNRPNPAV